MVLGLDWKKDVGRGASVGGGGVARVSSAAVLTLGWAVLCVGVLGSIPGPTPSVPGAPPVVMATEVPYTTPSALEAASLGWVHWHVGVVLFLLLFFCSVL